MIGLNFSASNLIGRCLPAAYVCTVLARLSSFSKTKMKRVKLSGCEFKKRKLAKEQALEKQKGALISRRRGGAPRGGGPRPGQVGGGGTGRSRGGEPRGPAVLLLDRTPQPGRRLGAAAPKSNYELFNCSSFKIRYRSWNNRGCWHQTCPPIVYR